MGCKKEKVSVAVLKSGIRRQNISKARSQLTRQLVEQCGLSLTQTDCQLGVSPTAVAKSIGRRENNKFG
jgi:hypothetical protein